MKKMYHIITRALLLVLVSIGILLSSYHYHNDLEWNHAEEAPHTNSQLAVNSNLCPVTGFHLKATFVDSPTFTVIESVTGLTTIVNDSQKHDPFIGSVTGRSPPFLG